MLRQDDAGPRVALRHVQRCHRQGSADLPGREAAREKQPQSRAPSPDACFRPSRLPGRTSVPTGALVLGVCVGQGGCPRPRGPAARRCRSRCRGGGAAAASRAGGRCGVCTFLTEAERHRGGRGDLPGGAAAGGQDRAARGSRCYLLKELHGVLGGEGGGRRGAGAPVVMAGHRDTVHRAPRVVVALQRVAVEQRGARLSPRLPAEPLPAGHAAHPQAPCPPTEAVERRSRCARCNFSSVEVGANKEKQLAVGGQAAARRGQRVPGVQHATRAAG